MKKFILGTVIGALLTSSIAFAAYTATENPFPVTLNDKLVNLEGYNIEGSTYFKLRDIADVVGEFDVDFKDNTIVLTSEKSKTPEAAENSNKYSRANPAPINTIQYYEYKNSYLKDYSANIRITEIIRGEKANKMVRDNNQFWDAPNEGYEYIVAKVVFSLLTAQADTSKDINEYDFKFYSSNNEEYNMPLASVDNALRSTVYAGGNTEGYIIGMVKKDDAKPKLAYGLDYNGANGVWFALYE